MNSQKANIATTKSVLEQTAKKKNTHTYIQPRSVNSYKINTNCVVL